MKWQLGYSQPQNSSLKDKHLLTLDTAVNTTKIKSNPQRIENLITSLRDWDLVDLLDLIALAKDTQIVPYLINLLENQNNRFIIRYLIEILGKFGDIRSRDAILEYQSDPDLTIRLSVIQTLRNIKSPENISLFADMLKRENNEMMRCELIMALGDYGNRKALKIIKPLLRDKSKQVRLVAAKTLVSSWNKGIVKRLKEYIAGA